MTDRPATRGFLESNIDVGFLADPKVLKLARVVPDEGERARTILVYLQTLLLSWHDGRRLTVEEAEATWEPTAERIEALRAVGLIDDEGRVPEAAWNTHYGRALERSERRRKAGRKGGKASAKTREQRSSNASEEPQRSSGHAAAQPQRRSSNGVAKPNLTPADPPSPKGEAGGGRVGQRVEAAPTRPPVRMDRLEDADIDALEVMRRELPTADGRRRLVEAEIEARRTTDTGASPDLRAQAEAVFNGMGATWLARTGRERGPDHA